MINYAEEQVTEQGSLDWQRARLGKITGSKCGDLMVRGRTKDEPFGATAKTYLYKLAAQRSLNPKVVESDEHFQDYLENEEEINSRVIRQGHEREPEARKLFEKYYHDVLEVVSCPHDTIEGFAASPDGIVIIDGREAGCLEIKSTQLTNFMRYSVEVNSGEDLKKCNPTYYWQTQAEMMCTNLNLTYFVVFNPYMKIPLHVVEIQKNEEDCKQLEERIREANNFIDNILSNYDQ